MAVPKFLAGLRLNGKRIQDVGDPSSPTDAANKQYVDNIASGLNWKERVRVASTGNVNLATGLAAGQSVDGVTLVAGDRVLLKDQTTASQNGIYVAPAAGAASRSSDADSSPDIRNMIVGVEAGTVSADKIFQLVTDNPTLDTTSLVFTAYTGGALAYVAGAGLAESPAGTFNVGAGNGISVNADTVQVDSSVVVRKGAANCAATTNPQTFAHGAGHADVVVQVKEGNEIVYADVTVDATNITVDFGGAPTAAQYRVIWHY